MAQIPNKKLPFYAGLRVLVIDHNPTVLQNIEKMCTEFHYKVITCSTFEAALNHIRESDVILVEDEMPNKDVYGFLQHVSKEVDAPIIVMSNNDSEDLRVEAFVHGACDYMKKPLNEENMTQLWQPVLTKAVKERIAKEKLGNLENNRKRSTSSKDSDRDEPDDRYAPQEKKQRVVVWDKELHNKFLEAVKLLGEPDKARPKKIHELMNIPNLTRENITKHLQKFRNQNKGKPDGKTLEKQNEMPLSNEFTFQPLRSIRQVSYQAVPSIPPHQWPNYSHAAEQGVSRNHSITRSPSNMSLDDQFRYRAAWLASDAAMRVNNSVGMQQGNHINNTMMNTLQQQLLMQHLQQQQQQQLLMQHHIHVNPASVNQNRNFGGNSLPVVQIPGQNNNVRGSFHGYAAGGATPGSIPQQGLANVTVPVVRSFPATVSATQFPESVNLGYDANEIMATKHVELENESSEKDGE